MTNCDGKATYSKKRVFVAVRMTASTMFKLQLPMVKGNAAILKPSARHRSRYQKQLKPIQRRHFDWRDAKQKNGYA